MNVRTVVNERNNVQYRLEVAVHVIRLLERERQELLEQQEELTNEKLVGAEQVCGVCRQNTGYFPCVVCHGWEYNDLKSTCESCQKNYCDDCGYSCQDCGKKLLSLSET